MIATPAQAKPPISVERIKAIVAAAYDVEVRTLSSLRRHRRVTQPRHVAMWLTADLMGLSTPMIGRRFGNRDHSTVIHAINRVNEQMVYDKAFAAVVAGLRRQVLDDCGPASPFDQIVDRMTEAFRSSAQALATRDPDRFLAWAQALFREVPA